MPVKVHGLRELDRKMDQLPKRVARKHLTGAVRSGARLVGQDARTRIKSGGTGKLRRAVYWFKLRARSTAHSVAFGISVRSKGIFKTTSGQWRSRGSRDDPKNVYYWTFIEFGTRYIAARPFLRPAFEARKRQALRAIGDALREGINKETRR